MKTNRNVGSFKLSLAAVAVASVAAPLIMITGSAGVDSGHFWVKAQYSDNPEIKAFAGINGTGKTEGENPGGENPGDGDPETPGAASLTFNCGPMTLEITEQQLAYSKIAEDLIEAGRSDEIQPNPEGWEVITTSDGEGIYNGLPPSKKAIVAVLGPYPFTGSDEGMVAFGSEQGDTCQVTDSRPDPKAGERVSYRNDGSGTYGETRYIEEEGKLRVVTIYKTANSVAVNRSLDLKNDGKAPSDRYPGNFTSFSDGSIDASAYFTNTLDGADEILMRRNADGSGSVNYRLTQGGYPNRSNNPTLVEWNSEKEITKLFYVENGETRDLPERDEPYTVEEYNQITGQNWDGKYHTTDDYDFSMPFEIVSP